MADKQKGSKKFTKNGNSPFKSNNPNPEASAAKQQQPQNYDQNENPNVWQDFANILPPTAARSTPPTSSDKVKKSLSPDRNSPQKGTSPTVTVQKSVNQRLFNDQEPQPFTSKSQPRLETEESPKRCQSAANKSSQNRQDPGSSSTRLRQNTGAIPKYGDKFSTIGKYPAEESLDYENPRTTTADYLDRVPPIPGLHWPDEDPKTKPTNEKTTPSRLKPHSTSSPHDEAAVLKYWQDVLRFLIDDGNDISHLNVPMTSQDRAKINYWLSECRRYRGKERKLGARLTDEEVKCLAEMLINGLKVSPGTDESISQKDKSKEDNQPKKMLSQTIMDGRVEKESKNMKEIEKMENDEYKIESKVSKNKTIETIVESSATQSLIPLQDTHIDPDDDELLEEIFNESLPYDDSACSSPINASTNRCLIWPDLKQKICVLVSIPGFPMPNLDTYHFSNPTPLNVGQPLQISTSHLTDEPHALLEHEHQNAEQIMYDQQNTLPQHNQDPETPKQEQQYSVEAENAQVSASYQYCKQKPVLPVKNRVANYRYTAQSSAQFPTYEQQPSQVPTLQQQSRILPTHQQPPGQVPIYPKPPSQDPIYWQPPGQAPIHWQPPSQLPMHQPPPCQVPMHKPPPGEVPMHQQQPGEVPMHQQQPGQVPMHQQQPGQVPTNQQQPGQVPTNQQQPGQVPMNQQQPGQVPMNQQQPGQVPMHQQQPGQVPMHQQQPGQVPMHQQQPGQVPMHQQQPGQVPMQQQQPGQAPMHQQQPGQVPIQQQHPELVPVYQQHPGLVPVYQQHPGLVPVYQQHPGLVPVYQQHQGLVPAYQHQGLVPAYQQHPGLVPVYQHPGLSPTYQQPPGQVPIHQQQPREYPIYQQQPGLVPGYQLPPPPGVVPAYQQEPQFPVYQQHGYFLPNLQQPAPPQHNRQTSAATLHDQKNTPEQSISHQELQQTQHNQQIASTPGSFWLQPPLAPVSVQQLQPGTVCSETLQTAPVYPPPEQPRPISPEPQEPGPVGPQSLQPRQICSQSQNPEQNYPQVLQPGQIGSQPQRQHPGQNYSQVLQPGSIYSPPFQTGSVDSQPFQTGPVGSHLLQQVPIWQPPPQSGLFWQQPSQPGPVWQNSQLGPVSPPLLQLGPVSPPLLQLGPVSPPLLQPGPVWVQQLQPGLVWVQQFHPAPICPQSSPFMPHREAASPTQNEDAVLLYDNEQLHQ